MSGQRSSCKRKAGIPSRYRTKDDDESCKEISDVTDNKNVTKKKCSVSIVKKPGKPKKGEHLFYTFKGYINKKYLSI